MIIKQNKTKQKQKQNPPCILAYIEFYYLNQLKLFIFQCD